VTRSTFATGSVGFFAIMANVCFDYLLVTAP
jgi:hypothetical protein